MDAHKQRRRGGDDDSDDYDDDVGETDQAAPAELGGDSDARPLFDRRKKKRETTQPVRSGVPPETLSLFHSESVSEVG